MWTYVMKFFSSLILVALFSSSFAKPLLRNTLSCPPGHYLNGEDICVPCSECTGEKPIISLPCTKFSNTKCKSARPSFSETDIAFSSKEMITNSAEDVKYDENTFTFTRKSSLKHVKKDIGSALNDGKNNFKLKGDTKKVANNSKNKASAKKTGMPTIDLQKQEQEQKQLIKELFSTINVLGIDSLNLLTGKNDSLENETSTAKSLVNNVTKDVNDDIVFAPSSLQVRGKEKAITRDNDILGNYDNEDEYEDNNDEMENETDDEYDDLDDDDDDDVDDADDDKSEKDGKYLSNRVDEDDDDDDVDDDDDIDDGYDYTVDGETSSNRTFAILRRGDVVKKKLVLVKNWKVLITIASCTAALVFLAGVAFYVCLYRSNMTNVKSVYDKDSFAKMNLMQRSEVKSDDTNIGKSSVSLLKGKKASKEKLKKYSGELAKNIEAYE